MESPQATIECSTVEELARLVLGFDASRVGVVISSASRALLFDALADELARFGKRVVRVPSEARDNYLQEALGDLLPPIPACPAVPTSSESVREGLNSQLREEQLAAQGRVVAARRSGGSPDPFDRDVAGWLATGLGDLFADTITGETFLKGAFARLAANPTGTAFTEADFLRPDGIQFLEAGRSAQSMLTKLSLASTNQFRASAVRLMNQIIAKAAPPAEEQSIGSRLAAALRSRGETLVILVENANAIPEWVDADSPIRLIVAGEGEPKLRERLTDRAVIIRFVEKPSLVAVRSAIPDDLQRLHRDLQSADSRIALFLRHGLLVADFPGASVLQELLAELDVECADENRSWALLNRGRAELSSIEQSLIATWQRWFAEQLADIDAELFLQQDSEWDFLDIPQFMDGVHRLLLQPAEHTLRVPANEDEFAGAEKFIAALNELDRKWRTRMLSAVDEGMAFAAAVAAGGAPLDLFTEGVKWWLREENKDWHKYRIVRMD